LLENNIKIWLFQAKRKDDRIQNIDVEDWRGEAHRLMVQRIFTYNEEKSGLKTYLERAFEHFGEWYVRKNEVTEERLFSSFDIQNDKGTLDFAARLVDMREGLPEENAHQQKIIEAVQMVIENLEVGDAYKNRKYNVSYKEIMQIYILSGKERAYEFMEREYGLKDPKQLGGYLTLAKNAFEKAAAKNPVLRDALHLIDLKDARSEGLIRGDINQEKISIIKELKELNHIQKATLEIFYTEGKKAARHFLESKHDMKRNHAEHEINRALKALKKLTRFSAVNFDEKDR
jgi:hypothetical protein